MLVFAFDFDGVLCDSSREVFVVAVDTFARLRTGSALANRLRPLRNEAFEGGEGFRCDPLYEKFLDLLPLGNRAEDFGVSLLAIEDGVGISAQYEYDEFYNSLDAAWRAGFHAAFYETRAGLRSADLGKWLALHRPYPGVAEALERHRAAIRPAVATAKDAKSISLLLAELGLAGHFEPSMVLDKETGVEKTHHLRALRERTGAEFSDITFIDDKVNHLVTVSELGVRGVLAGWGFNGDRELDLARRHGFEVAQLSDLDATLFKGV